MNEVGPILPIVVSWLDSLKASSRSTYYKVIGQYEEFRKSESISDESVIFRHFVEKFHHEGIACTSLWTIHSIVCKYAKLNRSFDLDRPLNVVSNLLKQWAKD